MSERLVLAQRAPWKTFKYNLTYILHIENCLSDIATIQADEDLEAKSEDALFLQSHDEDIKTQTINRGKHYKHEKSKSLASRFSLLYLALSYHITVTVPQLLALSLHAAYTACGAVIGSVKSKLGTMHII